MEVNSSKNTPTKIDMVATYQIIGGIIGLILQTLMLYNSTEISWLSIVFAFFAFFLYSFSVYCGIQLFINKIRGIRYSLVNQYLQLLNFTFSGFAFEYVSGVSFCVGIDFTNSININFNSGISTWHILINDTLDIRELNLNLIALFLIIFIERFRKKDKYSDYQINDLEK